MEGSLFKVVYMLLVLGIVNTLVHGQRIVDDRVSYDILTMFLVLFFFCIWRQI